MSENQGLLMLLVFFLSVVILGIAIHWLFVMLDFLGVLNYYGDCQHKWKYEQTEPRGECWVEYNWMKCTCSICHEEQVNYPTGGICAGATDSPGTVWEITKPGKCPKEFEWKFGVIGSRYPEGTS